MRKAMPIQHLLLSASFLFIIASAAVTSGVQAATLYADASAGNDGNDGQTPQSAKKTIQAAIGAAANGDTIAVAPGLYQEQISINLTLTLKGAQSGIDPHRAGSMGVAPAARDATNAATESIIDGNFSGAPVSFAAAGSVLDGFTIKDGQNGLGCGIFMPGNFGGLQIVNNIITNNTIGISANCNSACLIQNNLFDNNNLPGSAGGAGIYTDSITQDLTVNANEFKNHNVNNPSIFAATHGATHTKLIYTQNFEHDNVLGVFAQAITGAVFSNNEIGTNGAGTGITLGGGCLNVTILNNIFDNNLRGVRLADFIFAPNPDFGTNGNVTITQNSFNNCPEFGVGVPASPGGGYTLGDVVAEQNWWGNSSGPAFSSNPSGTGSPATDAVIFSPWLVDGTDTSPGIGFQPNLLPSLLSVNPNRATVGSENLALDVSGSNFVQGVTTMTWNGADRPVLFTNSGEAFLILQQADTATAGTATITAINGWAGGGRSNTLTVLVVNSNPIPDVSGLNPATAIAGSGAFSLTVTGSNFIPTSVVEWNGSARPTTFVSGTTLTAVIGAADAAAQGAATVSVSSPGPGGGSSNALALLFVAPNLTPAITGLSPGTIIAGSSAFILTVTGSNFVPTAVVEWNGTARPTTFVSAAMLTAAIGAPDIAAEGATIVSVFNPGLGGGASNGIIFSINAPPPAILSAITAMPNPGIVGQPVQFTVAAQDATGVSWDFGDGTTGNNTGSSVAHTYTVTGKYIVTVTATGVDGKSISMVLALEVDAAGPVHGAPLPTPGGVDELVAFLGSNPFGGRTPVPLPLNVSSTQIRLNFARQGQDSILLTGALTVQPGVTLLNQLFALDFNGVLRAFNLDKHGNARSGGGSVKYSPKKALFTVRLTRGTYAPMLAQAGLTGDQTVTAVQKIVNISLIFNKALFQAAQPVKYTSAAGKFGRAK